MGRYDFLVVGAGLFGATFAFEAVRRGRRCLVIDRRSHVAGNAFTESVAGINVHKYGAHIFHTSDRRVWEFARRFAEFNRFVNSPVAIYGDELYNLPFNMNTFCRLWGVNTPQEAMAEIERQRLDCGISEPRNFEEQALFLAGRDIYEKLIRGYTEKQWGRPCGELPASIIRRVPFRFTFDNNYYDDLYQGIPIGGYSRMVEKMLRGSDVLLNTDYFGFIAENAGIAPLTVFTGAIDEFFGYCHGELEYRSLRFETETLPVANFQGNAVVNYTAREIPYTRIIEHKHFEFGSQPETVVSREYPAAWERGREPYYPVNDDRNNALLARYKALAQKRRDVVFGGRLGEYGYFDMDDVIAAALALADRVAG